MAPVAERLRVLYATSVLPHGRSTGSEVLSAGVIDALRDAGHAVTVMGYARPGGARVSDPDTVTVGVRPIETASTPRPTVALWALRAVVLRRGFSESKFVSRAYPSAIRSHGPFDLTFLSSAQLAWLLPALDDPVVLVAQNVERVLYEEASRAAQAPWSRAILKREAKRMAAAEQDLRERCEAVWVLTASDAAAFEGGGNAVEVLSVPPSVDGVGSDDRVDDTAAGGVALLGTWTWQPNLAGLRWFVERVVPLLPAEVPVVVAGRGSNAVLDDERRIRTLGFVEDAAAFLRGAAVVAVPSTAGAGLQIKTLDAIATGRPVVATPLALRGIDDAPASVRVAETPEAFADALRVAFDEPVDPRIGIDWASARRERFHAHVAEATNRAAGLPRRGG